MSTSFKIFMYACCAIAVLSAIVRWVNGTPTNFGGIIWPVTAAIWFALYVGAL